MEYQGTFLPHIQPKFAKYFVTFTLYNQRIIDYYKKIKEEREADFRTIPKDNLRKADIQRANKNKKHFNKFDKFINKLDSTENYLSIPECAEIFKEKLEKHNGSLYEILAYCIMPNHVHVLIDTEIQKNFLQEDNILDTKYVTLGKIMQLIKGASSREINLHLGRKGTLWLRDYWDHYLRSDNNISGVVDYIKLNPVKAGLVKDWTEWKYLYISEKCY